MGLHNVFSKALLRYEKSWCYGVMEVHNAFFKNVMRYRYLFKSVIALWIRPIKSYALLVFFYPALWSYGVLFSRKRSGFVGALKEAEWRYEAPSPRFYPQKRQKNKVNLLMNIIEFWFFQYVELVLNTPVMFLVNIPFLPTKGAKLFVNFLMKRSKRTKSTPGTGFRLKR